MTSTQLVLIALAVFVVVIVARSITIVPAAHAGIVERLGKYQRTVPAGLSFVIPVVDRVRRPLVDLGQQALDGQWSLSTADSHLVSVSAAISLHVVDPQAATYQVSDYRSAIDLLAGTTLGKLTGAMGLDEALTSRAELNRALVSALSATAEWGVRVDRVEVSDFRRPRTGRVE